MEELSSLLRCFLGMSQVVLKVDGGLQPGESVGTRSRGRTAAMRKHRTPRRESDGGRCSL